MYKLLVFTLVSTLLTVNAVELQVEAYEGQPCTEPPPAVRHQVKWKCTDQYNRGSICHPVCDNNYVPAGTDKIIYGMKCFSGKNWFISDTATWGNPECVPVGSPNAATVTNAPPTVIPVADAGNAGTTTPTTSTASIIPPAEAPQHGGCTLPTGAIADGFTLSYRPRANCPTVGTIVCSNGHWKDAEANIINSCSDVSTPTTTTTATTAATPVSTPAPALVSPTINPPVVPVPAPAPIPAPVPTAVPTVVTQQAIPTPLPSVPQQESTSVIGAAPVVAVSQSQPQPQPFPQTFPQPTPVAQSAPVASPIQTFPSAAAPSPTAIVPIPTPIPTPAAVQQPQAQPIVSQSVVPQPQPTTDSSTSASISKPTSSNIAVQSIAATAATGSSQGVGAACASKDDPSGNGVSARGQFCTDNESNRMAWMVTSAWVKCSAKAGGGFKRGVLCVNCERPPITAGVGVSCPTLPPGECESKIGQLKPMMFKDGCNTFDFKKKKMMRERASDLSPM